MLTREALSSEHAELEALAEKLIAEVAKPERDAKALATIRWRLNHLLAVHLAKEDNLLYPQLQNCGKARTEAIATRFAQEMGGLAAVYLEYSSRWTSDRIAPEWEAFKAETRKVMQALCDRIRREERYLYPLLGDDKIDRSAA